jgi:hypothetical protein
MKNKHLEKMSDLFSMHKVMDLLSIQAQFPDRSRSSIIRDLKSLHYLTSYNHAGYYYTIIGIPSFDSDGVWWHKNAYFSSHGSLKGTVKYMVVGSTDGRTHDELRQKLGIRVQNTLLDLVGSGTITREKFSSTYLYVSNEDEVRNKQLSKRSDKAAAGIDPYTTIEILRTVIKHPGTQTAEIHRILAKEGASITVGQVENVFVNYDLEKKTLLTDD